MAYEIVAVVRASHRAWVVVRGCQRWPSLAAPISCGYARGIGAPERGRVSSGGQLRIGRAGRPFQLCRDKTVANAAEAVEAAKTTVEPKKSKGLNGGGEIPHSAEKTKGQRPMAVLNY